MSIRQRLAISFLAILMLFAFNLGIYFWSNQRRSASVEDLRLAIARQILVSSIEQKLSDLQKFVALLSPMTYESTVTGAGPDEILQFDARLNAVSKEIWKLQELPDSKLQPQITALADAYEDLGMSWRVYYLNLGHDPVKEITELATRADPLSQKVIQQLVPQLHGEDQRQVEEATIRFYEVAKLTDRITIFIFALSTAVAIAVSYLISRYLIRGLDRLKYGAALIGEGDLTHRISSSGNDEISSLGFAFNEMTRNLQSVQIDLRNANEELEQRHQEVKKKRHLSESLLHNILPIEIATEWQAKDTVEPKYFEDVSVLFTDFVNFTRSTEDLPAEELVYRLHDYFTAFDKIVDRYGLEKLKTIGDSYMCVGGLPVRSPSHPLDMVLAAFEMLQAVADEERPGAESNWAIRIGIHTGPVIAGVVGIRKFAFDVWGDTVNYSSRMESCSASNEINLSAATYLRVKDFIECEHRGKVRTKEDKALDMYFARGLKPSLLNDSSKFPPPDFVRRYRIYFEKDPPAFPPLLAGK